MNKPTLLLRWMAVWLFALPAVTAAQNAAPDEFPPMPAQISHMEADLRFSDPLLIEGDVRYEMVTRTAGIDSLVFNATGLEIERVLVNDEDAPFQFSGRHLIVYVESEQGAGEPLVAELRYRAEPRFGLLRNHQQTLFTSLLPDAAQHWLPVPDSPHARFTTDISITHNAGLQVVANGRNVESTVLNVDRELTRFTTNSAIPATALFIAIGEFETESRTFGRYRIHLHTEQAMEPAERDRLIELADQTVRRMEQMTGRDYPYRDLQLLWLHDRMWETRHAAAGVVVLEGDSHRTAQLRSGVTAQWAGVMLRPLSWQHAAAVQFVHAVMQNEFEDEQPPVDTLPEHTYDLRDPAYDGVWRASVDENVRTSGLVEQSLRALFNEHYEVTTWYDLARFLYERTGQPAFDEPRPVLPKTDVETMYRYRAVMTERDEDGEQMQVEIRFEAEGEPLDELVTLRVTVHTFRESTTSEITFSGAEDRVMVPVSPAVERVLLEVADRDDVVLLAEKPFLFWVNQLQQSDDAALRAEAAAGLRNHSHERDLQLALMDVMRGESDTQVLAELLRTLGTVTDGATGTEQTFLDRARQGQDEEIQLAAVEALANYSDQAQVQNSLQTLALRGETTAIRTRSLRSLAAVTDRESFAEFALRNSTNEQILPVAGTLLGLLAENGNEEVAADLAITFTSPEFPDLLRRQSLSLLMELDAELVNWSERFDSLLGDRDPRIRHQLIGALDKLSPQEQEAIRRRIFNEEFDERVLSRL
ncbi:MAG: hypothetical protein ACNA78_00970 [Balneolaceae bacterium]